MVGRMPIFGSEPIRGNGFFCILWVGGFLGLKLEDGWNDGAAGNNLLIAGHPDRVEIHIHGENFLHGISAETLSSRGDARQRNCGT